MPGVWLLHAFARKGDPAWVTMLGWGCRAGRYKQEPRIVRAASCACMTTFTLTGLWLFGMGPYAFLGEDYISRETGSEAMQRISRWLKSCWIAPRVLSHSLAMAGCDQGCPPSGRDLGKVVGVEAKERFYRRARYLAHYPFVYGIYGLSNFMARADTARNPVSFMGETWADELQAELNVRQPHGQPVH